MGANLSFHTSRFDIHQPYRLHPHADIAGGLGIVLPGTPVQVGTLMLAACVDEPAGGAPVATGPHQPPPTGGGGSNQSQGAATSHNNPANAGAVDGHILRCARAEDVGIVHRVVITTQNDGFVLLGHHSHCLASGAPITPAAIQKRLAAGDPTSLTIRITTAALREVRIGGAPPARNGTGRSCLFFPRGVGSTTAGGAGRQVCQPPRPKGHGGRPRGCHCGRGGGGTPGAPGC